MKISIRGTEGHFLLWTDLATLQNMFFWMCARASAFSEKVPAFVLACTKNNFFFFCHPSIASSFSSYFNAIKLELRQISPRHTRTQIHAHTHTMISLSLYLHHPSPLFPFLHLYFHLFFPHSPLTLYLSLSHTHTHSLSACISCFGVAMLA